eukprot:9660084-Alexandrium_andersonii.AAC.1
MGALRATGLTGIQAVAALAGSQARNAQRRCSGDSEARRSFLWYSSNALCPDARKRTRPRTDVYICACVIASIRAIASACADDSVR